MIDLLPIDYVSDPDNRIPDALRPYFQQQGFNLAPYRPEQGPGAVFLVFSPLWNGDKYLSVEGVWARYLAKDFPSTKMIVMGNIQSDDPNYVDLLRMPENWAAFLEQAPMARRFITENPVFTGGMDIVERLKRFLMGHGDESMADICGRIWFKLRPSVDILDEFPDEAEVEGIRQFASSDSTQAQWNTLLSRWRNYQSFFGYLPFGILFLEMGKLIEDLKLNFEITTINDVRAWLDQTLTKLKALEIHLKKMWQYVG